MKKHSNRKVRKELARLDELVSREGKVLITRRGKLIARLLRLRAPLPGRGKRGGARVI